MPEKILMGSELILAKPDSPSERGGTHSAALRPKDRASEGQSDPATSSTSRDYWPMNNWKDKRNLPSRGGDWAKTDRISEEIFTFPRTALEG